MNTRKKLVIVFVFGLFLLGLGSGIAFAEFSSFQYGGEKNFSGEMTAITLSQTLDEDIDTVYIQQRGNFNGKMLIEADSSLPVGQIAFEVMCNEKIVTPFLQEEKEMYRRGEYKKIGPGEAVYSLDFNYYNMDNEMSSFIKGKDELLEAVKNRVVYNYKTDYVQDVVIKAAPDLVDHIILY